MKLGSLLLVVLLAVASHALKQKNTEKHPQTEQSIPAATPGPFFVFGATAEQEATLRFQIHVMRPEVLPLRIFFVPHWKYINAAKTFQLHVPKGMGSVMFTHLASQTVFIDNDHYLGAEWLGYWMAHELGHLAKNSAREDAAEKVAHEYRKRLKEARIETR
jgi:hypothetical protein